uniref:Uncharacterized protein n=1 Tax=Candidatus Methanophaga sp. ANME-1 ERB7 TaxID=2759913 RepID=A0A7G9Z7R0_9EURY|nr:hypothetical protein HFIEAGJK_00011 [Methanosarcinales archaeon ANME-1 ERB7]
MSGRSQIYIKAMNRIIIAKTESEETTAVREEVVNAGCKGCSAA